MKRLSYIWQSYPSIASFQGLPILEGLPKKFSDKSFIAHNWAANIRSYHNSCDAYVW